MHRPHPFIQIFKPNEQAMKVIEDMDTPEGKNILSLGVGDFHDEKFFAAHGCNVTAIEANREKYEKYTQGFSAINVKWGHIERIIPHLSIYEEGKYDVVYARLSLHYFGREELEEIFTAIEKLLAPGGKLYLTVKTKDDPHYRRSVHVEGKHEDEKTWLLRYMDPQLNEFFSRQFFDTEGKRIAYYLSKSMLQLADKRLVEEVLPQTAVENIIDDHPSQLLEVTATKPSSGGRIPIESIFRDGKLNIFLLEKLLTEEASSILKQMRGSDDIAVRILFFGSGKYMSDDSGWVELRAVSDFDPCVAFNDKPKDISGYRLFRAARDKALRRVRGYRAKRALMRELESRKILDKRHLLVLGKDDDIVARTLASIQIFSILLPMNPRQENLLNEAIKSKIKRAIQLLYYAGDKALYIRYRDEF